MEILDTLCMLVSKLQNGVAYRWNRKALMLQRSQQRETSLKDFIEFFWSTIQSSQENCICWKKMITEKGEVIARSVVHLQQILTIINLKIR